MSSPTKRLSWTRKRNRSAAPDLLTSQLRGRGSGGSFLLLVCCLLLPSGLLWSASPPSPLPPDPLADAEQVLRFADALFHEGDYFRAITEYKRFLFLAPTHPRAEPVQLQIGLAYLRGQQWEDARRTFQALAQRYPDAEVGMEAAFLVGETAYLQGEYARAIDDFRSLAERRGGSPAAQKARYRLGWSYLRTRQWPAAVQNKADEPSSILPPLWSQ